MNSRFYEIKEKRSVNYGKGWERVEHSCHEMWEWVTVPKNENINFEKLPQQLHLLRRQGPFQCTSDRTLPFSSYFWKWTKFWYKYESIGNAIKQLQRQGLFQDLLEKEIDWRIVLHDSPYTVSQTQGHRLTVLKIGCRAVVVFHMPWKMPWFEEDYFLQFIFIVHQMMAPLN